MPAGVRPVVVEIPRTLASLAGNQRLVDVDVAEGCTVADVLAELGVRYPVLARRVRDETGAVRRYVNIYVGVEDIRQLDGLATSVEPGRRLQIIQSVAGG